MRATINTKQAEQQQSPTGLMNLIETLENAKRQAAASYARMGAHPSPQDAALTTRDEQEVLRARVDVLNTLLRQGPGANPLCLEATGRTGPRVCVTYDRLRCEGELELGPMQSTMAWAVRDAEDAVLQLMSAADSHPPTQTVQSLLGLVRQSAPKKDVLQGLHAVLSLPSPERLVLKSVQGINAQDGHARVYEGLGEAGAANKPVPPLYRVIWGALSLDVLEGWQNPSTNAAIRLSILDAAHQAAREAQRTKAPAWSNVAYLQVRVYHGEECHRLSLRPFWDSESCTVSHIQFKQSVFDDSGPERGLLNLSQDPSTIHPIPMGAILPLQAYVCLGAHRKNRLSEAQLNYVHAQGLLAHEFDPSLLPDSSRLLQVQPGRMPPAKATRVSADKLDVMASSYHIADQVYTTITVVQYPPFGTQFERTSTTSKASKGSKPISKTSNKTKPLAADEDDAYDEWDDAHVLPQYNYNSGSEYDEEVSDEETEASNEEIVHRRAFKPSKKHKTQNLLYLKERPRIYEKYDGPKKKHWFTGVLQEGQFFFVDGVHGDPFDLKNRIILFDFEQSDPRFLAMEQAAKQICFNLRRTHGQIWNPELSFYGNVHLGTKTALAEHGTRGMHIATTIGQEWSMRWSAVIKKEIEKRQSLGNIPSRQRESHAAIFVTSGWEPGNIDNFWYCPNTDIWHTILAGTNYSQEYKEWSISKVFQGKQTGQIPHALMSRLEALSPQGTFLQSSKIPLPPPRLLARPDQAVVGQLQTRIAALESRLGRVKQDENTQFLLARVLEKLEEDEDAGR